MLDLNPVSFLLILMYLGDLNIPVLSFISFGDMTVWILVLMGFQVFMVLLRLEDYLDSGLLLLSIVDFRL